MLRSPLRLSLRVSRLLLCLALMSALVAAFFPFAPVALAAPCLAPGPGETDITAEGSVFASTTYPGYAASLSVDCDTTTSWFSTGPEPNKQPTIFRWTGAHEDKITTIWVKGNADHPQYPTGFGFGNVTVRVKNAAGAVVFEQQVALPGTPDPDVLVHPNVVGQVVELAFTGHESKDCGGFSELRVFADRTPPTTVPPTAVPAPQPTTVPPPAASAPPAQPGDVIVSDNFNAPDGDLCNLPAANNGLGGSRKLFYLPIFPTNGNDADHPIGASVASGALQNNGLDFGGFQYALAPPCNAPRGSVRGADLGQDLNIVSDLLVPTNAAGLITEAGPYIRSRAAAAGDGIIGGDSAGYWVILDSTGQVTLKGLNPFATIASSGKPASFDASVFHTLEIAAGGNQLQVALDGKLQTFSLNNQLVTAVALPPSAGSNNGTAGIAFGAEANRGKLGGQRADNVIVKAFQPLSGLPVQNNFAQPNIPTPTLAPTSAPTQVPSPTVIPAAIPPTVNATALPSPTVALAPTTVTANALSGDCDGDGQVTEVDALCALEISVQLRGGLPQMDMDGDGSVTSRDAVLILERVVSK